MGPQVYPKAMYDPDPSQPSPSNILGRCDIAAEHMNYMMWYRFFDLEQPAYTVLLEGYRIANYLGLVYSADNIEITYENKGSPETRQLITERYPVFT